MLFLSPLPAFSNAADALLVLKEVNCSPHFSTPSLECSIVGITGFSASLDQPSRHALVCEPHYAPDFINRSTSQSGRQMEPSQRGVSKSRTSPRRLPSVSRGGWHLQARRTDVEEASSCEPEPCQGQNYIQLSDCESNNPGNLQGDSMAESWPKD